MALRRSRVRIPLGPPTKTVAQKRNGLFYPKARIGVVGHPGSEQGERGGSPAGARRERQNQKTELADRRQAGRCGETESSHNRVARYSRKDAAEASL